MQYWLFKSEPLTFSIDDLNALPKQNEPWDGVRNFQARNFLRDEVKLGDVVFFYHSSCTPPGIAGTATVVRAGYPDISAFDINSRYYDPRSTQEKPIWYSVDVKFSKKFHHFITLAELKIIPQLKKMTILKRGNRLSITKVSNDEAKIILALAK